METTGSCAASGQAGGLTGGVPDGAATPKFGGVALMLRVPAVSIDDGLTETINWIRDHLDMYNVGQYGV